MGYGTLGPGSKAGRSMGSSRGSRQFGIFFGFGHRHACFALGQERPIGPLDPHERLHGA